MAYCGKCGAKNPDGAKFCGNCGASLVTAESNATPTNRQQETSQPVDAPRQQAPRTERVVLRPGSTLPPRREGAPRRTERPASQQHVKTQPDFFEPRKKKGGKLGGCMKRFGCGLLILLLVIGAALWAIGTYYGGDEGDGGDNIVKVDENDNQNPSTFEKMMTPEEAATLATEKGFPATTGDVAPLAGDYTVSTQGYYITVTLKPEQNGKIVGKVKMSANGYNAVSEGVYCYCGNSIYAIYKYVDNVERNKVHQYFYAQPDRKSIVITDGEQYTLKRKDPEPIHRGKGSGTLLSRNYCVCMTEASLSVESEECKYPETDDNHALQFGNYATKAEVNGETHTVNYVLEPYEGENLFIVAKLTAYVDGDKSRTSETFVGYCGHSIYAAFRSDDEEDITINSKTQFLFYAYDDGKSFVARDTKQEAEFKLQ